MIPPHIPPRVKSRRAQAPFFFVRIYLLKKGLHDPLEALFSAMLLLEEAIGWRQYCVRGNRRERALWHRPV